MVPADSRRITRAPRYSGTGQTAPGFAYGALTLYGRAFQPLPVRSPLLGESLDYFLLLEVLRCFSSLGSPPELSPGDCPSDSRVVPFGNPRIKGYLHLHAAYRSLSRPSSPG